MSSLVVARVLFLELPWTSRAAEGLEVFETILFVEGEVVVVEVAAGPLLTGVLVADGPGCVFELELDDEAVSLLAVVDAFRGGVVAEACILVSEGVNE